MNTKYHKRIKNFLENKGLEVLIDLEQDEDSAKFSDALGVAYEFPGLYNKLYNDIVKLDLGQKLTINDFFHEADRGPEGIYVEFALNKKNGLKDSVEFSEDYFEQSFIRYVIKIQSNPYDNLDDFIKNHDFMKNNYNSLENIFKKLLDPNNQMKIREEKEEDIKNKDGFITRSFSDKTYPSESLSIYTDGEGKYFLHMQFKIDNKDKNPIFNAINESRNIFNQYLNKTG